MASSLLGLTLISLSLLFLPSTAILSFCNGPCLTLDDCASVLVCSDGKCTDDPDVGSNICGEGGILGGELATCKASGTLKCGKRSYPQFRCSPPVTSSTRAKLTINGFQKGGEGGDPSECDGKFHSNKEHIVALSTGWYAKGARCGKMIRITASNGRSVTAKVVDECDSINGCDHAHAGLPPCRNNIVDGSKAVWEALGLKQDLGIVDVTWSMA